MTNVCIRDLREPRRRPAHASPPPAWPRSARSRGGVRPGQVRCSCSRRAGWRQADCHRSGAP
jgi:hypothetical protein